MNNGTVPRSPAAEQERVLACAFADRLDALRGERGLTQETFARAAGLTPSSLARIRTAPRKIHLSLIQRVCRALQVTYDDLLSGLPEVTERYTRTNRAGVSARPTCTPRCDDME
jgi:transcriptional regulator with XRE-family HTH domain